MDVLQRMMRRDYCREQAVKRREVLTRRDAWGNIHTWNDWLPSGTRAAVNKYLICCELIF
jgi:hypothetical protein